MWSFFCCSVIIFIHKDVLVFYVLFLTYVYVCIPVSPVNDNPVININELYFSINYFLI